MASGTEDDIENANGNVPDVSDAADWLENGWSWDPDECTWFFVNNDQEFEYFDPVSHGTGDTTDEEEDYYDDDGGDEDGYYDEEEGYWAYVSASDGEEDDWEEDEDEEWDEEDTEGGAWVARACATPTRYCG